MKRIFIVTLLALFALNVSCGSTTVSSDTTPREAKVIALTGTLMALVANMSAVSVVEDSMGVATSGTISTPITTAYSALGLEGTSDDTLTVEDGSWTRTTSSGITTITLTGIDYTSQMVEYPWNDTTAGAIITFDGIDFTVSASTDPVTDITGSLTATIKGTGSVTDLTPTEYTVGANDNNIDIGTMTINILAPEAKTGTVTFKDTPVFGGSVQDGKIISSTILNATVGYEDATYTCIIIAGYTPATMPGNTGIGQLTVTSATCSD